MLHKYCRVSPQRPARPFNENKTSSEQESLGHTSLVEEAGFNVPSGGLVSVTLGYLTQTSKEKNPKQTRFKTVEYAAKRRAEQNIKAEK